MRRAQALAQHFLIRNDVAAKTVVAKTVYTEQWNVYKGPVAPETMKDCRIIAGRSHPGLAAEVVEFLGKPLCEHTVKSFADGEVSIQLGESVRGKEVFILQPMCRSGDGKYSVNDALVELCLLISACRRHSAATITAVVPYFGYGRQDRTMHARVPISAADVAQMLCSMGVDHMVACDLHVGQIQGFFPATVAVDDLDASPLGALYFLQQNLAKPVVVSPDAGGVARAKEFRDVMALKGGQEVGFAMIVKQRAGAGKISSMDLVGEVVGCDAIICDDMIDTAGTLCSAAALLKENGAKRVFAFATHGLFSGPAAERISSSVLDQVVVANTVPLPENFDAPQVVQLSLAPLLSEVIQALYKKEAVTDVYKPLRSAAET